MELDKDKRYQIVHTIDKLTEARLVMRDAEREYLLIRSELYRMLGYPN